MWKLSKWILVIILTCTNGYEKKCPHSSQWNFTSRSFECSDQNIYICLFDASESNGSKAVFTGKCGHLDLSREGSRYILTPDLNQVPCSASRYQPFTFTTNGNSQCVLSKSLCKGIGQILANNGSSFTDISCRCDYRHNYDYIIPPKDPCACKPAEEDCSCYIRKCEDDKVMIADYRCLKRVDTILPEDIKCPIIIRIIPPEKTEPVNKIQLQSVVTGSSTWSIQASVILIGVIIIYTVLIGFLFFSVPYVKIIDNEFIIVNGANVKIECKIESYIPVRSVNWQKEIDGEIMEITAYEDKYKMDCGKCPSLTIDSFNTEDQGKYRCIVRNAIGLRNEIFGSCLNYMSGFGWLKGFVSVLQHIPVFHTEDMTLHSYDIESQSKPTVYNVYKGEDITMEQCCDDQQKLKTVKWFNENDRRIELDLSNKQYSGGVLDCPSLTIKDIRMENAGKYFCLLIYDNGKTKMSSFILRIILQVKIYKALLDHREDRTFIRPAICDTIDKQIQENNIVVITGREGTGKSKICLELASHYDEKDYMVLKVDLSENHLIYTDISNALLIIDDQQYTQHSLNAFMKELLPVLPERNIQVVLTCRNLDLKIVRNVPEMNNLKSETFIDVNSCLTPEEKEEILRRHMQENNISSSASYESNFRDPRIVTDLSEQVTLDENAIKLIRNEEPWKGFPLSALLFCSERKCLHLGEKYFTNPPRYLFKELKELYRTTRKNSKFLDIVNEYCILVYIIDNSNHQLDLNDPDLCRKLVELYGTVFQFKYIPEKPGSNEDQKIAIEKALHSMNNKYLKIHEGVYKFIHPCLSKAMFLSSDYMFEYLLQKGSLSDITEFVRSKDYTALENELVIKVTDEHKHNLCESLLRHAFENHNSLQNVAKYIYTHWRLSDSGFVDEIVSHIESILFQRLGVQNDNLQPLDNDSFSESSINLEDPVKFSNIIALVDELTYKGRDPWIYKDGKLHIFILSGLVTAAMHKYATSKVDTFEIILSEFQKRMQEESFVKLCNKPLDACGNTIFHFLMHFNEMEVCQFLTDFDKRKIILDTENVKKYTPLDIASYLGKVNILKVPNIKTNCTKKLRDRLGRLARNGKVMFYDETSKNKSYEQAVVDIIKDSEKLHKENADDGKEEVKNEIQKKETFLKRTWRFIKNQQKKTEKHDKIESELEFIDILCLDDSLINAVEFGKVEDYQLVINLLS